jgi:hypothetical protein
MCCSTDLDAHWFAEDARDRRGVSRCRPQLELRISACSDLQEPVITAVVEFDACDRLRMTPIEVFREAQHGRQRADRPSLPATEADEAIVTLFGRRPPMVAGDERNSLDLFGLESAEIAVLDQIVGVLVVALVADMDADIMKQCRIFEPLALTIGEPMRATRLIEECNGEARDLTGVLGPVIAPFRQLHDAAAPDVGISIRLRDLFAVTRDIVEYKSFAKRQIAERQLRGVKALHDCVEQDCPSHSKVCPAKFEPWLAKPGVEVLADEFFSHAVELLG